MKLTDITSFTPKIKVFDEYYQSIEIWEHPRIWRIEDEDCYSDFLLQELNQIKEVLKVFVSEGYSKRFTSTYEFSFLRNLAHYFSKTKNFKESVHRANGWAGILGLEFAKAQLKIFRKKFGRIPLYNDEGMNGIIGSCQKRYWKEFGIHSWNGLLHDLFGKIYRPIINYKGKNAFERSKKKLKKFYQNEGRKPFTRDLKYIAQATIRGCWKEFGIHCWNDLLRDVFKEVNREHIKYVGKKGLNRAKEELLLFYKINGRLPRNEDAGGGIKKACKSRYWEKWNVLYWNDLLREVFGKINIKYNYYQGKEGLERAKDDLGKFQSENGRIPCAKDISSIANYCFLGYYSDYGVNCWNDLLIDVFGRVNVRRGIWVGLDGLDLAKKELTQFHIENGRKPTSADRGMRGIQAACCKGKWEEYGINSWLELKNSTFKKIICIT